jgi:lysophospholipase L1-like esterase
MIGINDFWGTQTAQESAVQYRALLKELREKLPAAQIVVESLFPTLNKEEVNKKVVELNKMLPDLAKSINADYLDVYSKLVDVKGDLKAEYSRDGVHLKPPAYDVWIDTMKTKLSDAKK